MSKRESDIIQKSKHINKFGDSTVVAKLLLDAFGDRPKITMAWFRQFVAIRRSLQYMLESYLATKDSAHPTESRVVR